MDRLRAWTKPINHLIASLSIVLLTLAPFAYTAQAAPAASDPPFCISSQLRGSQAGQGATGAIAGTVGVTNFSSTTCILQGNPMVQPVDNNGTRLPVKFVSAPPSGGGAAPLIVLTPGRGARASFVWRNFCGPTPALPIDFLTILPNNGGDVMNPVGAPVSAAPRCDSPSEPSTMTVQPFEPLAGPVPHDARFFPQTGFRIDDDVIFDYFNRRGGVNTFGFPVSRTFLFQGFLVQFFQRRIVQIGPNGNARLLNVLDPGLLPFTSFNFATFPAFDPSLAASAPPATDQAATLAFVRAHAPDTVNGMPTNFFQTFINTVSASVAFPRGGDPSLLPGFDLEMWGIPTSAPAVDPHNHNFINLRFQRGIMMFDASCTCTRAVLLADYLKSIITGNNLPADLNQEAMNSPFYKQYDPGAPRSVRNPSLLPNTDLTDAFTKE